MRQKLTLVSINRLPHPESGSVKYWDTVLPGFGVRVTAKSKSYFLMFGKDRRLTTIAKVQDMSLSAARTEAKRLQVTTSPKKRLDSLREALTAYLDECETKNRPATVRQYRHFLSKVDKPYLNDVTRDDINITSPHEVVVWKAFFNWCIRMGLVEKNPFVHITPRWNSRTRVLSDLEVQRIFRYEHRPYSDYVKLLFLTGQRIGQFKYFKMRGDELIFPSEVMKNRKEHAIPLTEWTQYLLDDVKPFNGWSKAKKRIDAYSGVEGWVHHDARRYFSTTMASLQVPLHVTETILSHTSGQVSGVAATYNRYNYLIEMREALSVYESHIKKVVNHVG